MFENPNKSPIPNFVNRKLFGRVLVNQQTFFFLKNLLLLALSQKLHCIITNCCSEQTRDQDMEFYLEEGRQLHPNSSTLILVRTF